MSFRGVTPLPWRRQGRSWVLRRGLGKAEEVRIRKRWLWFPYPKPPYFMPNLPRERQGWRC